MGRREPATQPPTDRAPPTGHDASEAAGTPGSTPPETWGGGDARKRGGGIVGLRLDGPEPATVLLGDEVDPGISTPSIWPLVPEPYAPQLIAVDGVVGQKPLERCSNCLPRRPASASRFSRSPFSIPTALSVEEVCDEPRGTFTAPNDVPSGGSKARQDRPTAHEPLRSPLMDRWSPSARARGTPRRTSCAPYGPARRLSTPAPRGSGWPEAVWTGPSKAAPGLRADGGD